jgi:hypothetical protein
MLLRIHGGVNFGSSEAAGLAEGADGGGVLALASTA